jgi:eukaryotic-like serine/threonine-protein kinase
VNVPTRPPPTDPAAPAEVPTTRLGTAPTAPAPMATGDFEGTVAGYTLVGEIARGGMGIVYRAYDLGVDRDVAIKVLQESFRSSPSAVRRFIEEGQVTGQLQHPGIPAIHQIGYLPDGSPFLAMKLIQGETLSDLLRRPDHDRQALVPAFQKIAETVAYAHSRHVIHRDLKPANVMIGAFGEVQVMDWGIAKLLSRSGFQPDQIVGSGWKPDLQAEGATADFHPANGTAEDRTTVGQIVGTPAYMAPEQARGEIDRVDERADVFALGGILLRLLTGAATFSGNGSEALAAAQRGQLGPAFARLDGCGADLELIALAKRCLDPARERRPKDAAAVASAIADLQAAAEERARRAELDRVRAETQAAGERKRRRVQLALAAAVIGILLIGGGGWTWMRLESRARTANAERGVSVAHEKADQLQTQAGRQDLGTVAGAEAAVSLWQQALAAAEQADGVAANSNDDALKARAAARTGLVREGLKQAEGALGRVTREATLLANLEAARAMLGQSEGGAINSVAAIRAYVQAFAAAGLPKPDEPIALARAIRAERAPVRAALVIALDTWAGDTTDLAQRKLLHDAADAVDPDPVRKEVRAVVFDGDLTNARKVAQGNANLSAPTAVLLGGFLRRAGAHDDAERVLRRAADRFPTDFWVLEDLGAVLSDRGRNDSAKVAESIGCRRAAVAIRPNSAIAWTGLGIAQAVSGNVADAETCFTKAIALDRKYTWAHVNLGNALKRLDNPRAAEDCYKTALSLDPNNVDALTNLGNALALRQEPREAEAYHRKAIEVAPRNALPRNNLGDSLVRQGDLAGAEENFRQAVALDPTGIQAPHAHTNLGLVLVKRGALAEAELYLRRGVELNKRFGKAHEFLIEVLFQLSRWEAARDAARHAVAVVPANDPRFRSLKQMVTDSEQILTVADKVPAALAGGNPATNRQERFALNTACTRLQRFTVGARLAEAGFAVDRSLRQKYNAACFLVLASSGRDAGLPKTSEEEWAYLVVRAYNHLRDLLGTFAKWSNEPARRKDVANALTEWKDDPLLNNVRHPDWLEAMPEIDRERWTKFWDEVDALLKAVSPRM